MVRVAHPNKRGRISRLERDEREDWDKYARARISRLEQDEREEWDKLRCLKTPHNPSRNQPPPPPPPPRYDRPSTLQVSTPTRPARTGPVERTRWTPPEDPNHPRLPRDCMSTRDIGHSNRIDDAWQRQGTVSNAYRNQPPPPPPPPPPPRDDRPSTTQVPPSLRSYQVGRYWRSPKFFNRHPHEATHTRYHPRKMLSALTASTSNIGGYALFADRSKRGDVSRNANKYDVSRPARAEAASASASTSTSASASTSTSAPAPAPSPSPSPAPVPALARKPPPAAPAAPGSGPVPSLKTTAAPDDAPNRKYPLSHKMQSTCDDLNLSLDRVLVSRIDKYPLRSATKPSYSVQVANVNSLAMQQEQKRSSCGNERGITFDGVDLDLHEVRKRVKEKYCLGESERGDNVDEGQQRNLYYQNKDVITISDRDASELGAGSRKENCFERGAPTVKEKTLHQSSSSISESQEDFSGSFFNQKNKKNDFQDADLSPGSKGSAIDSEVMSASSVSILQEGERRNKIPADRTWTDSSKDAMASEYLEEGSGQASQSRCSSISSISLPSSGKSVKKKSRTTLPSKCPRALNYEFPTIPVSKALLRPTNKEELAKLQSRSNESAFDFEGLDPSKVPPSPSQIPDTKAIAPVTRHDQQLVSSNRGRVSCSLPRSRRRKRRVTEQINDPQLNQKPNKPAEEVSPLVSKKKLSPEDGNTIIRHTISPLRSSPREPMSEAEDSKTNRSRDNQHRSPLPPLPDLQSISLSASRKVTASQRNVKPKRQHGFYDDIILEAVQAKLNVGESPSVAFRELSKGVLSNMSERDIATRWYSALSLDRQLTPPPETIAVTAFDVTDSKVDKSSDSIKTKPPPIRSLKIPSSSSHWFQPKSEDIDSSHPDAEADCTISAYVVRHLKFPSLQRLLSIPHSNSKKDDHRFVLSVSLSSIPNAGRGLFLTYKGPDKVFRLPGYIDLGCYGPHKASDLKRDFLLDAKNFVFCDRPSEWSFTAPSASEQNAKRYVMFGSEVYDDMMFDITDDSTGEVHDAAERTLLPFVNEVCVFHRNGKLQCNQVQTVDAVHHDNGALHYLLRAGSRFTRDEKEELLLFYGNEYQANRDRKYEPSAGGDFVSDAKDNASVSASGGESVRHSIGGNARAPYYHILESVSTYTEDNIKSVLDLFLSNPPRESRPRQRMDWLVRQMKNYAETILFRLSGSVPRSLSDRFRLVLASFPRGAEDPHFRNDLKMQQHYRLHGTIVMNWRERKQGWKAGIVEHIAPGSRKTGEAARYIMSNLRGELMDVTVTEEAVGSYRYDTFNLLY